MFVTVFLLHPDVKYESYLQQIHLWNFHSLQRVRLLFYYLKTYEGRVLFFSFFNFLFYQSADSILSLTLTSELGMFPSNRTWLGCYDDLSQLWRNCGLWLCPVFVVVVVGGGGVVVFFFFLVLFLKNDRAQENSKLAKIVQTETKLFVKTEVTFFDE